MGPHTSLKRVDLCFILAVNREGPDGSCVGFTREGAVCSFCADLRGGEVPITDADFYPIGRSLFP